MKTAVVPAQVTTVEDRIAGNLGLNQLLLLITPVFVGSVAYVVLPPFFRGEVYKYILMVIMALCAGILSIRIKGVIVLLWLVKLVRYYSRPRLYVYDKRSLSGRDVAVALPQTSTSEVEVSIKHRHDIASKLTLAETITAQELLQNPLANPSFEIRKGGMYVRFTDIKQES